MVMFVLNIPVVLANGIELYYYGMYHTYTDNVYSLYVNGQKINVKDPRVKQLSKKHLPKRTSDKIMAHARGRFTMKAEKKNSR